MEEEIIFTLFFHGLSHEFSQKSVLKISKKINQQVKIGIHTGTISRDITDETFQTFCNALELKKFKATASNAFDLLDLANDWEVPSLSTFVSTFILDKGLQRPTRHSKYRENLSESEEQLIENVSNEIDKYLEDDRLLLLPPEVLFRIILTAERKHIDQNKLINFVMKLFQYNPIGAVCQTLTLDFQALTNEQRNKILSEPLMHEQNLLYFISASLSSLRKNAKLKLEEMRKRHQKEFEEEDAEIQLARGGGPDSVEGIISQLKQQMKEQREQIHQLNALLLQQQQTLENGEAATNAIIEELEREIAHRVEDEEQSGIGQKARLESIQKKRTPIINKVIQETTQKEKEIIADHGIEMDQAREYGLQQIERTRRQTSQMDNFFQAVGSMTNKNVEDLDNVRKVVATKAVLDKIRYDNFLRTTANRTLVFDESFGTWEMSKEEMEQTEEMLNALERTIDQACPIIRKFANSNSN